MISVRIYGCLDNKGREQLRKCTRFFVKELLPKKRQLLIIIKMIDNLVQEFDMLGSCELHPRAYSERIRSSFIISLDNSMEFPEMVSILAHEIGHVKQYVKGELSFDSRNAERTIWMGEYADETLLYEDEPWEIDAIECEHALIRSLIKNTTLLFYGSAKF